MNLLIDTIVSISQIIEVWNNIRPLLAAIFFFGGLFRTIYFQFKPNKKNTPAAQVSASDAMLEQFLEKFQNGGNGLTMKLERMISENTKEGIRIDVLKIELRHEQNVPVTEEKG